MHSTLKEVPVYRTKLWAYLELMRPANVITAFADILAGFSIAIGIIAGSDPELVPGMQPLVWLLISTFGLYGGGVVFNDFFDAKLDAEERPERPVPSGRTSRFETAILGFILLLTGILAAFQVHVISGGLSIIIVLFVLIYDSWAKQFTVWGPLFMGLCRGCNLLLGASATPYILSQVWFLGIIPIIYIAAITLISQGEVHGGKKTVGIASLVMLCIVFIGLTVLNRIFPEFYFPAAAPFLILLGILIVPAFVRATRSPVPGKIRVAVKRGVLALIVLNAVIASGFVGWTMGVVILLLLPFSILLGRIFAVT